MVTASSPVQVSPNRVLVMMTSVLTRAVSARQMLPNRVLVKVASQLSVKLVIKAQ